MNIKLSINIVCLATAFLLLSFSDSAAKRAGSASASIQATARVVPSQGIAVSPVEVALPDEGSENDWWLWIPDNEDLQISIEADGRPVESQLLTDDRGLTGRSALERHRHNGLIPHRLSFDSLPEGTATCTVTLTNPSN